jgi:hypothetical protein
MSVLDGPRQASWHFFVTKTGEVYQHVDTDNIAWTNGGFDANRLFWGIECEGVAGEPLTEPQFEALVGVVRWLWDVHDVGAFVRQETAWEHNEMTQFGSAPTSCPSGRIPWGRLISSLEDDMPTLAEIVKALKPVIAAEAKKAIDAAVKPVTADVAALKKSHKGGELPGIWVKAEGQKTIYFVEYVGGVLVRHHAQNPPSYLGVGGDWKVITVTKEQLELMPQGPGLPDLKV